MIFKEMYDKLNPKSGSDHSLDCYHLDCLLNADKFNAEQKRSSRVRLSFKVSDENGDLKVIPRDKSIPPEKFAGLNSSSDIVDVLNNIYSKGQLTYALMAPAFLGQFTGDVTPGKLRSALKALGFDGVIEVALFADILTLKEALEFDKNIIGETDFQITSCCCPMWIAMIKKMYSELMPHMAASVSPMIAGGRVIKKMYKDAITVFIGPCIAKKTEAKEKGISDAIDYVLTFREVQDIFDSLNMDASDYEETEKYHSSYSGRIYARKNGVSEAVKLTLDRINPNRKIAIKSVQADGVPACRQMINNLLNKKTDANFFEGMGCVGGCVGGPRISTTLDIGTKNVTEYSSTATFQTPIDNPYIIELLRRIGIESDTDLLNAEIFQRTL